MAGEELLLACIPNVVMLHLLFDTSKHDVKDLTVHLHHSMPKRNILKINEMYIRQQKKKYKESYALYFFSVSQELKAQKQPL